MVVRLERFVCGGRAVNAEAEVSADGFTLRLQGALLPSGRPLPGARRPLRVVLRVRSPVGISIPGCKWPFWSMARSLSPVDRDMSFPLRWLARRLCDVEQPGPQRTGILLRCRRFLNELLAHAAVACNPVARRLALRFRPSVRLRIYDCLVDDATGRVAQLAETCAGGLLFALALRSEPVADLRAAGDRLLSDAVAGRPIDPVLDEALEAWVGSSHTSCRLSQARWLGAWQRVDSMTRSERRKLLAQKRLLIRRAGRLVNPFLLLLPPPLTFAPDDVPKAPRANARWYAIMQDRSMMATPDGNCDHYVTGLCHLLSRVAPLLWNDRRIHPNVLVGWLLDFLRAAGRAPTRSSSLPRLIEDSLLWHANANGLGSDADERPFPPIPLPEWSSDSAQVTALHDAAALRLEGTAMSHCVGSYADLVRSGAALVYSARIDSRRLTVEVRLGLDGVFDIVQIAGRANRPATLAERAALRPWLAELNRRAFDRPPAAPEIDGAAENGYSS